MRISKHLLNLLFLCSFGFLVTVPFGLSMTKVGSSVLGEKITKDYYKKPLTNTDNMIIKTISQDKNYEIDSVTVVLEEGSTLTYSPLYEITNVSNKTFSFSLNAVNNIIGNMTDKKLTIREGNENQNVFYDGNKNTGVTTYFNLEPGESTTISVVVNSGEVVMKSTPLSFDLKLNY